MDIGDFTEELERIEQVRRMRQEKLATLPPNTPNPKKCCERSYNEHLQDDIDACDALEALLRDSNTKSFIDGAWQDGYFNGGYLLFAVKNVYREWGPLKDAAVDNLLLKIFAAFGDKLRSFEPFYTFGEVFRQRLESTVMKAPWHNGILN